MAGSMSRFGRWVEGLFTLFVVLPVLMLVELGYAVIGKNFDEEIRQIEEI